MKKYSLIFLFPLFLFSGCIAVEEKLYLGPDCILLDVRSEKEYKEGHNPKAIHIPHTVIEREVPRRFPGKETPFFIYCRSGKRAGIALEKLKCIQSGWKKGR